MDGDTLVQPGYIERLADRQLSHALHVFPAVEVTGPMWCGKTWTSLAHGRSVTRLGQPQVQRLASADPNLALAGDEPHVVDEWQDVPEVWDAVRADVDSQPGRRGRFILTGSSTPAKDRVAHSGAGRISRIPMHTMSFLERRLSSGAVSLAELFEGDGAAFDPIPAGSDLASLAGHLCHGGWPAMVREGDAVAAEYVDEYIRTVCDVNLPRSGVRADEAASVLRALARNDGGAAKLSTLVADAFQAKMGASERKALGRDLSALKSLYLLDELPGWDAPVRARSRVRTKPKRYLADPSLTCRLLGVDRERLLGDGQLFGQLFEAQAVHDLRCYAEAAFGHGARLHHYRDADGLEVDAVIELDDGRWGAVEVKLGENKVDDAAKSLRRLEGKVGRNPLARNPHPTFKLVLLGACEMVRYDRSLDVFVAPLVMLGP